MTEVASLLPNNHRLTSVKHYEAGPPENLQLVEPGETYATTKEEEWISKKKTEVLNTKQIETRVKRQVVLEDGKVVEDSGPMVTTNTTEDTETQEHHHTELRKLGDDEVDGPNGALENGENSFDKSSSNWISVPNPDGIVREVKERRVVSREETEEIKETENVQHLGDITDEEFLAAVKSGKSDIQSLLRSSEAGKAIVSTGPRVIRDTSKSKKVSDTEDTRELSSVLPNGKIVTETQRTTEHEEVNDDELPDNAAEQDYHKESSQRYLKTREQEDVDYLENGRNVGHEMKYKTETMEIEKHGDDEVDLFESLSTRAKNKRINGNKQPQRIRGISEWNERRQEPQHYYNNSHQQIRHTPSPYSSQSPYTERPSRSPIPDYHRPQNSPIPDYHRRQYSPIPDYRNNNEHSPSPDYGRPIKITQTPVREFNDSPTPPQRKNRTSVDRKEKFLEKSERRTHYDSGYRSSGRLDDSSREDRVECLEEPPPDYSPPSPPPMPREDRKQYQKTRFAADPPKVKSGNIIGQSIRKLVNKIRSASAERKAKNQRAKRSPSPSYQPGHVIDNNIGNSMDKQPVQRYYLGEDPFGGSIYGRENKYDGVKPARNSRRSKEDERGDRRSQSTLGRFSKSTSRLVNRTVDEENRISSQTLPRHLNKFDSASNSANTNNNRLNGNNRSNSTINVSIINTVNTPPRIINDGPIKPIRTYKSNLSRSKSLIVHGDLLDPIIRNKSTMYTSNSNINGLNNNNPSGLKSPGLISSLNRSHRDINNEIYTSRFQRNGDCVMDNNNTRRFPDSNNFGERITEKKVYVSSDYKNKSPDYFRTMNGNDEDWRTKSYNNATTYKTSSSRNFNSTDVYEPPTRLRDNHIISASSPSHSILRRGSNSSTDFSETYHTTSRNDDPHRPSVTNTVKTISKKTIPGKHGRGLETIESSEMKSITKSHYRSGNNNNRSHDPSPSVKFFESERRYDYSRPVVIEVKRN